MLKSPRRLLVPGVAHAGVLWHTQRPNNLMIPKGPGEELAGWQAAVLRTSRHVTYF